MTLVLYKEINLYIAIYALTYRCAEEYRKGELYEQMEEKRRWDLTKKEDKRRWNKEHKYKIEKSQKEFEQKERYLQSN